MSVRKVSFHLVAIPICLGLIVSAAGCQQARDKLAGVDRSAMPASPNAAKAKVDELAAYYSRKIGEVRASAGDNEAIHRIAVSVRAETISDEFYAIKAQLSAEEQSEVNAYFEAKIFPLAGEWMDTVAKAQGGG